MVITCSTSRPKGSMPVAGSQRPNTLARWTSQAARYWRAPPRSYSCSTRVARRGAGPRLSWRRTRACIEVFSSEETTKSRFPSGFAPFPGVEVEHPRRFGLEVGIARKIHERCRQGLMASSESQRQIVAPEISATMPRSLTSARMSGTYSRLSGTHSRLGSSQAKDLTATTTSGGKDPGSTAAGRSSRPASPCSKKRFRHFETITRLVSSRGAISSLSSP